MKPQIATTIEQSRRLLACGVDPKTADMSVRTIKEPFGVDMGWQTPILLTLPYDETRLIYGDDEITPAWSLSALLELMPQSIDRGDFRLVKSGGNYIVGYCGLCQINNNFAPIEACVQMIEWLSEHNYSLNKTEE